MAISNEAVEAAAGAMAPVVKKLEALILSRAALEAAAPLIQAEALEDASDLINDLWTWEWSDALVEARDLLRSRAARLRQP